MTTDDLVSRIEALISEVKLDESPAEQHRAATPVEIDRVVAERILLSLVAAIRLGIPHLLDAHTAIFMDEVNRVCTVESLNLLLSGSDTSN